ncbi:helix-turn-helix domain-containing protein [Actinokineospora sp. HUAS TT18]|uniref:helix-turn-helix domain-containing protein n=1 Tax=Actinokineospora sp. HUAS TT18 TaxID=3447451 RepID=UPI003F524B21
MSGQNSTEWHLGTLLREARLARHLTQTAAAERAGISRTLWQQLETGSRPDGRPVNPKRDTLRAVAAAVDLTERETLEAAGHDPSDHDISRPGRPLASLAEARDLLSRLNDRQRQAVVDMIRAFHDPDPDLTAEPFRQDATLTPPDQPE